VNRLIITTHFADAVVQLLLQYDLIETNHLANIQTEFVSIRYPDDAISQALLFWLHLAVGCGLISDYRFES
jgi:hypothetical protein